MPRPAGNRTERITFSRPGTAEDDYGGEGGGEPTDLGASRAEVIWGRGSEIREAAAREGSQTATFVVLSSTTTRAVQIKDSIGYQNASWDITAIVLRGRTEIELTATRSV